MRVVIYKNTERCFHQGFYVGEACTQYIHSFTDFVLHVKPELSQEQAEALEYISFELDRGTVKLG